MTSLSTRLKAHLKTLKCKYGYHKWEHVIGSVKSSMEICKIDGGIMWKRRCYRCMTEQDCSRIYGFGMIDAERKFS